MATILRSALSMSAATTLSRLTGYARTLVQAGVLGTGATANAYAFSNALPTQLYEIFVGGLLSSVFVPLLVERLTVRGEGDANRLANALLTLLLPAAAVVVVLCIVFAGPLVGLLSAWGPAQGFSRAEAREATALATLLFRVFAAQVLFYVVGALATGFLNARRRFFLPTLAPVLNNLLVIAAFGGFALLAPGRPQAAIYVLAGGTTLGVAAMSLALLPAAWRLGYRPRLVLGHPSLPAAARLAGPVLLLTAATVGVQVFSNLFGSRYGGVAQLLYAFTIFLLPYGVFVAAIATALLPELSERFSSRDAAGYGDTLSFGLRVMAFIAVPASVALISLSEPIVGLLYEHGEFTPADTTAVALLLSAYAFGLLGYSASFVLVRAFFARQNSRTPAALNVGLLVLFVLLCAVLSGTVGLVGVPLAFSGAYTLLAGALLVAMRSATEQAGWSHLAGSLIRLLVAGAAMFGVARFGLYLTGTGAGIAGRAAILIVVGGAATAAYLGTALMLGSEEPRQMLPLLRGRPTSGTERKA